MFENFLYFCDRKQKRVYNISNGNDKNKVIVRVFIINRCL